MYLIVFINSFPREIILVILFTVLILIDYGHQCALGCFHSSSYCKYFRHLSFSSITQSKKEKQAYCFIYIYICLINCTLCRK